MIRKFVIAAGVVVALTSSTYAQQVLKNEPPAGGLRGGEVVLVDDGKCPKGMIKKVTAGTQMGGGRTGGNPTISGAQGRTRQCVPRS